MRHRILGAWILGLGLCESACVIPSKDVGELPGDGTGTDSGTVTADGTGGEASGDSSGTVPGGASNPACGPDGPACVEDEDRDCVPLAEDNAPEVYNPDQSDIDGDLIADPIDACPVVAALQPGVELDGDHDGLGNGCDPCRRAAAAYEANPDLPGYLRIRNVPSPADADGDGIGDACDNCIHVPNCQGYDLASPWQPGDPIADGDPTQCQADADGNGIGDACEGLAPLPGAAGVVGLGPNDDLDQDGLPNLVDACPRAPLSQTIACATDDECPFGRTCEVAAGLCDHLDVDADGVGDVCDTCPMVENPLQIGDDAAQAADDPDGDFRGNACELAAECEDIANPSRIGFYPVSAGGHCCTVSYPGDYQRLDPDGLPLVLDCSVEDQANFMCRPVPGGLGLVPGYILPPLGCEQALADAGLTLETNLPLHPDDVGGIEALWSYACLLPPLDQDFDGLADACDPCPFAFDPTNEPFIDANGMLWPNEGKYCNGDYALENSCPHG